MPDASAPTQAAPNGSTGPATSAPAPTPTQGKPTPGKGGPRSTDGKFLPKDSSSGVEKTALEAQGTPEAVKEAYRFKKKLKVYGEEQELDLDEDGLSREIQVGRAAQRKAKELAQEAAQAKRLIDIARSNPDAFLRQLGHDPDDFARQRVLEALKMEQMSEAERALHQMQQKYASLEAENKQRAEQEKTVKETAMKKQLREGRIAKYSEALKAAGLEAEYENIYLMAETERLARGDDDKAAIELTPEELAKETNRRMGHFVENYLKKLDAKTLMKKLGDTRVKEICDAVVAEFEAGTVSPVPQRKAAPPEPTDDGTRYTDIREVEKRLKKKYGI